jgi:hypothetical protein
MENDNKFDNESEEEIDNEDQVKQVYDALFDAIPDGICSFNVLVAINQLALDWAIELHDECHGDNNEEDESQYGNIPGTSFSKS